MCADGDGGGEHQGGFEAECLGKEVSELPTGEVNLETKRDGKRIKMRVRTMRRRHLIDAVSQIQLMKKIWNGRMRTISSALPRTLECPWASSIIRIATKGDNQVHRGLGKRTRESGRILLYM
jgi:hypothetical protein